MLMNMPMFNSFGKLFHYDLKKKAAKNKKTNHSVGTLKNFWHQVQSSDGKQICTAKGKYKFQPLAVVGFKKENPKATCKGAKKQ